MKTNLVFLTCFLFLYGPAYGQNTALTKIYFFSSAPQNLVTTLNPGKPIKINRLTLLETDQDSLGLQILDSKTVYLRFEAGKTYYYRSIADFNTFNFTVDSCSENEFWLNVHFIGARLFRHYSLVKNSGLKLLEEK